MPDASIKSQSDVDNDVLKIKEWMTKQPHLPPNLDDASLVRFLHSCYYSLEMTKKCIEKFYTMRAHIPEIFSKRDPCSDLLQTQFDITNFCTTRTEDKLLTFWQLHDPGLHKYVFFDCMKAFFMQIDVWLLEDRFLEEEDIVVIDMGGFPIKIITAINISVMRKSFIYLLEAVPTRLTQIHAINCPPFTDKLFALVKPILPQEICDIIHFHQPNTDTIYKYVPKECIPEEFGGKGPKAADIMTGWITRMKNQRDFFLDDTLWIADEDRRMKKAYADEADLMKGSFRALCLD